MIWYIYVIGVIITFVITILLTIQDAKNGWVEIKWIAVSLSVGLGVAVAWPIAVVYLAADKVAESFK